MKNASVTEGPISFADPSTGQCPFAAYRKLQVEEPVYRDPKTGIYEVVGAAEIRAAAQDVETFSNRFDRRGRLDPALYREIEVLYENEGFPAVRTLLNNDADDHRKYRGLVERAFTAVQINALMPAIRSEVISLIEACDSSTDIEFVSQFAVPLPLTIIADQLGLSRSNFAAFKAGSDAMLAVADPLTPPGLMIGYVRDIIRMQHILAERLEHARVHPDTTILGAVANSKVDGDELTIGMLVNLFQNILVAGNETTTNALGNALQMVIEDPALGETLRRDPTQVRNFVEEALRMRTPLQGFFRVVTRDTALGGVSIPAGATVMLRWGAGGMDPKHFQDPDALKLDRPSISQHMSFGHGVHSCIGNQLARAEMRTAFEAIIDRWPRVRFADRTDPVCRIPTLFVYGPRQMWIRVD